MQLNLNRNSRIRHLCVFFPARQTVLLKYMYIYRNSIYIYSFHIFSSILFTSQRVYFMLVEYPSRNSEHHKITPESDIIMKSKVCVCMCIYVAKVLQLMRMAKRMLSFVRQSNQRCILFAIQMMFVLFVTDMAASEAHNYCKCSNCYANT